MGCKKEQLILQAIEERQRFAGRHLLSRATEMAEALVAYLKEHAPGAEIATVGSVRRGAETSGDLDILASGADAVARRRVHALPAGRARARPTAAPRPAC